MWKYIIKRFFASVFTLFVVITLTFFLMRFMPGSPFTSERITKTAMANMNAKYGLDKPLGEQYLLFMGNIMHGDFGTSMTFKGKEVTNDIIFKFFPTSAKLGVVVIIVSLAGGLILGLWSGLNQKKWQDKVATVIATFGIAVPSFVMSFFLIKTVGKAFGLSPTGFVKWQDYIMPVLALSGSSLAFVTRLTRTKYIEVRNSDFMRTAKAKGLSPLTVTVKHGLRNSMIPVVTYMGPMIAGILTGSFIVEKIFAIPGLGRDFVGAVSARDYSVVMGVVAFYCVLIILCNFIVDILYVVIDPRIKFENTSS